MYLILMQNNAKQNADADVNAKKEEPESWGFTAGGSEARRNGEDPSADGDGKQPISTSSHVLNGVILQYSTDTRSVSDIRG
jgi:hypothetical protein